MTSTYLQILLDIILPALLPDDHIHYGAAPLPCLQPQSSWKHVNCMLHLTAHNHTTHPLLYAVTHSPQLHHTSAKVWFGRRMLQNGRSRRVNSIHGICNQPIGCGSATLSKVKLPWTLYQRLNSYRHFNSCTAFCYRHGKRCKKNLCTVFFREHHTKGCVNTVPRV